MKVCIFSYYNKKGIESDLKKSGIKITSKSPDFVITYGGDGTILDSERKYPGVPKIPIRNSYMCSKCRVYPVDMVKRIAERLKEKKYNIIEEEKVEAQFKTKKVVGLNEVQIRNKNPNKAIRFTIDNGKELVGDGVVASTPYGSTAYYSAMGYKSFNTGIRLGLNNIMSKHSSYEIKKIKKVTIRREKGMLLADNDKRMIELNPGDTVTIRKSKSVAKFVEF